MSDLEVTKLAEQMTVLSQRMKLEGNRWIAGAAVMQSLVKLVVSIQVTPEAIARAQQAVIDANAVLDAADRERAVLVAARDAKRG